jgi:3-dehydroquinate synthase
MQTIEINGKTGNSIILIGEKLQNVSKYISSQNICIITEENVHQLYKNQFPDCNLIIIGAGEKQKNLSTIEYVFNKFLTYNIDRHSFIVGIGGGVITDITGFAASIYKRGIRFGFVASTLLAQVDAAIGGKNGINFPSTDESIGYKNLIGTIRQPEFVICDPELLKTLQESELINGFAEILKTALIGDKALFEMIETNSEDLFAFNTIEKIIYDSASVKAKIVQMDELDNGIRTILNFGHTFGHAIESQYNISHGEAVSIGMVFSLEISVKMKLLDLKLAERMMQVMSRLKLPLKIENIDISRLRDLIVNDKKNNDNLIKFILLEDIGKPVITELDVDDIIQMI